MKAIHENSAKGYSLIELMVGSAVLMLVLFAAGRLYFTGLERANSTIAHYHYKDQMGILSGYLQKYLVSGDTRFFGFTFQTEKPLGRVLIPQPCRSSTGAEVPASTCNQSTSFRFVHYDKTTQPALSAICTLPTGSNVKHPTEPVPISVVLDLLNPTYGTASLQAPSATTEGGVVVTGGQKLRLGTASQPRAWAMISPPDATLWKTQGAIEPLNLSSANVETILGSECAQRLQKDSSNQYVLSGLYKVDLLPLELTPFTGGNAIPNEEELLQLVGSFPQRVIEVSLRSLGIDGDSLGVVTCTPNWNCGQEPPILSMVGAQTMTLQAKYFLGMGSSPKDWYQYTAPGAGPSGFCDPAQCAAMPVPPQIPGLVTHNETPESLDPSQFSLIKQEGLSRLRFRVTRKQTIQSEKPEVLDVQFP
jgi:hypothetical protein